MKYAIQTLFVLRGSRVLQKALFTRLWRYHHSTSGINDIYGLLGLPTDGLQDEAPLAFCVLMLQRHLHLSLTGENSYGSHWQQWLQRADEHSQSWYVQLVLRYILLCACDVSCGGFHFSSTFPELDRLQSAWAVPALREERHGELKVKLILRRPDLWQTCIDIAKRRPCSGLLEPLMVSLSSLVQNVSTGTLTVQEVLEASYNLNAWENPNFMQLLNLDSKPDLQRKLGNMISKVRFMQRFEVAVNENLLQLFPRQSQAAKEFATFLYGSFIRANCDAAQKPLVKNIAELSVQLAQLNADDWKKELDDEKLRLSIAGVSPPSFVSILAAIETLHLARSEKYRPLRSMLQEAEEKVKKSGQKLCIFDAIFFLYREIMSTLGALSELGGDESGLQSQVLYSIEKHWDEVPPQQVPQILEDVHSVTSVLGTNLSRLGNRLEAVLRSRQTVEFWRSCSRILAALSSTVPRSIPTGFKEDETLRQEASVAAMHSAFEGARGAQNGSFTLPMEDLDRVGQVTEQTRQLFGFLGSRGFDSVLRLVASMAEVPGLSFLKILLDSAQKGEHLATRLADIMEGGLTPETLENVERASFIFMPLCAAVLSALNCPIDARKFSFMVEGWWPEEICHAALKARSITDIGDLLLRMLQQVQSAEGCKLSDFFESLKAALRLGQLVQQKLEENSDDATAVSNTVHGMVSAGYLELSPNLDNSRFEVIGVFGFNQERITRDMQQLTECSDKASLAVPKGGSDDPSALTQEKVQVFTGCIEGIIGLRQELTELLQIGHPYLENMTHLRFPLEGEGLSSLTVKDLKDMLKAAREAVQQWYNDLDAVRARHPVMSCVPARNVTKLTRAILEDRLEDVKPLLSLEVSNVPRCTEEVLSLLGNAFQECKFILHEKEAHKHFLENLAQVLASIVSEEAMTTLPPLHELAKKHRQTQKFRPDDATKTSQSQCRSHPKFYPKRVVLVKEEQCHESGSSPVQSTASITLLSIFLSLGVGPSPENVILCDSSTTKDDILRFLHRVTHAAHLGHDQKQIRGVFVHVDCLHIDVLQLLVSRVEAMHAAVGKRKESASAVAAMGLDVPLVFTITSNAPSAWIENLEKDLCRQQPVKILKLFSITSFLASKDTREALGNHCIVCSDFAGDGKTHAIHRSEGWDSSSYMTAIWGGAQTRGQAARVLRKAGNVRCLHLELHGFEEGGGVDADLLLLELLLFRCVFDPERSEWTRLRPQTKIFVEVANSIKISHGAASTQLMLLSAPILQSMPEQFKVDPSFPFSFDLVNLHPEVASPNACDFAVAGAALLLEARQTSDRLVGWQDDAVFKFLTDGTIVAGDHAHLLQNAEEVYESAQIALQGAWLQGDDRADREVPVLSKATVLSFLTFLANWTRKWALHTFHFEQQLEGISGVDIHGTFIPVLKAMIGEAAEMCLRSSAAEAQQQQQSHMILSEAMAARVVDGRASASTVWAFNAGGSLRFIGNSSEVPAALKKLWQTVKERTRQAFPEPLPDLSRAKQEDMRALLVEVLSGHGSNPKEQDEAFKKRKEELEKAFKGIVLTRDNMIKLVDVAERLRAKLLCILMGEAGCGKTVPWFCLSFRVVSSVKGPNMPPSTETVFSCVMCLEHAMFYSNSQCPNVLCFC